MKNHLDSPDTTTTSETEASSLSGVGSVADRKTAHTPIYTTFIDGKRLDIPVATTFSPPPVPSRAFDWSAVNADTYDGSGPVGYGRTEADAVADLLEQVSP